MTSPIITRDEANHVYVDGVRFPGVDTLLRHAGLKPDYSMVPPAQLEIARNRGIRVDLACQFDDEGCLDASSVYEDDRPYVEAWQKFKVERRFVPALIQPLGYHPALGYCGIPDVSGIIDKRLPSFVDRKATSALYHAHGLQLAAYTMPGMIYIHDGKHTPLVQTPSRLIVQLLKTGEYKAFLDTDEAGKEIFTELDWDAIRWAALRYRQSRKKAA